MWRHLNTLLFWGIFSSVTFQKAVLSCDTKRPNEFSSPSLNSNTNKVVMGENVSLLCSHKNKSLEITYFLFLEKKLLVTKTGRGEAVTFNLTISSANDLGPYKCKATAVNCSTYSVPFNFTVVDLVTAPVVTSDQCSRNRPTEGDSCPMCPLLPLLLSGLLLMLLAIILVLVFWLQQKSKARKAQRENVPKDSRDIPMGGGLYENICRTPAGTEHNQEIHYATPVFQKAAPGKPEDCHDHITDYTYSELTF